MFPTKIKVQPNGLRAFIRVESIQEVRASASSLLGASSRSWMSSMIMTSGRLFFRLIPRTEVPAPAAHRTISRPRKWNTLLTLVSVSMLASQWPNTLRMLGELSMSQISERILTALASLAPTIRMKCLLEKRIYQTQRILMNVVFAKPRGIPMAKR